MEHCDVCGKDVPPPDDALDSLGYDVLCQDCYDDLIYDAAYGYDNPLMEADSDR